MKATKNQNKTKQTFPLIFQINNYMSPIDDDVHEEEEDGGVLSDDYFNRLLTMTCKDNNVESCVFKDKPANKPANKPVNKPANKPANKKQTRKLKAKGQKKTRKPSK